jgi:hypothetical protein
MGKQRRFASVDFGLGGTHVIGSMVLWNLGGDALSAFIGFNLIGFELYAPTDASFATSTLLGS